MIREVVGIAESTTPTELEAALIKYVEAADRWACVDEPFIFHPLTGRTMYRRCPELEARNKTFAELIALLEIRQ